VRREALVLEKLEKSFGRVRAVDSLSLEILGGEVFCLLGPNGAGKTTTIRMICGLLPPDGGRVLAQGGGRLEKSRVGLCPQEIILWESLSCMENLVFMASMYGIGGKEARRRAAALLDALALGEKANRPAKTLSGGMQRRLNLALALIHEPEVVVLDEPEAGLDSQSRVMVRSFIRDLARDKTVVVTTHNMDEAERIASRCAIIDHGRLLALGSPDELKASLGRRERLELEYAEGAARNPRAPLEAARVLESGGFAVRLTGEGSLRLDAGPDVEEPSIPRVLAALGPDLKPDEIRLRKTTLEDVFIQLTGRSIRE
jgi:ABC-2 type transport system ATP-binding protein